FEPGVIDVGCPDAITSPVVPVPGATGVPSAVEAPTTATTSNPPSGADRSAHPLDAPVAPAALLVMAASVGCSVFMTPPFERRRRAGEPRPPRAPARPRPRPASGRGSDATAAVRRRSQGRAGYVPAGRRPPRRRLRPAGAVPVRRGSTGSTRSSLPVRD